MLRLALTTIALVLGLTVLLPTASAAVSRSVIRGDCRPRPRSGRGGRAASAKASRREGYEKSLPSVTEPALAGLAPSS